MTNGWGHFTHLWDSDTVLKPSRLFGGALEVIFSAKLVMIPTMKQRSQATAIIDRKVLDATVLIKHHIKQYEQRLSLFQDNGSVSLRIVSDSFSGVCHLGLTMVVDVPSRYCSGILLHSCQTVKRQEYLWMNTPSYHSLHACHESMALIVLIIEYLSRGESSL